MCAKCALDDGSRDNLIFSSERKVQSKKSLAVNLKGLDARMN
jgi:hypothetical protein